MKAQRTFARMVRYLAASRLAVGLALAGDLISALSSPSAQAANAQWTGTTDSNWATPTNWSANPVPGTGDTATFGFGNGGHTTISLGAGVTINILQFDTAQNSYTIGAGAVNSETLTVNNGGLIGIDNTLLQSDELFNAAIVLGTNANTASYQFANFSIKTLMIAGNVSAGTGGTVGTKTLTLSGTDIVSGTISGGIALGTGGTVTLSATNTFTGAVSITAGKLSVPVVNDASADGPLGHSAAAVQFAPVNGSAKPTLEYTGGTASSNKPFSISGGGNAAIQIDTAAANLTLNGLISGAGSFTKSGAGTLTVTAANSYTLGTDISAGILVLSGVAKLGATTGGLTVDGALDLGGTSQTVTYLLGSGSIYNNGSGLSTLSVSGASPDNFSGTIADNTNAGAGTVALTKTGTLSIGLSGANTYSGATNITAGLLYLSGNGTLGNAVGGTTVSSGATLEVVGVNIPAEAITISGTGSGGIGAILNSGDTTYGGLLKLAAAATISSNDSTFSITNTGTITGATFGLTLTGAGNGSIASVIGTTTGGVTISGGGTWTLTGANTFTGALTISGNSTLIVPTVNNESTDGPLGHSATTVTLSSSTIEYNGATASSTKKFTLSTGGTFQIDSAATELTLSTAIAGAAATLNKTGAGTLTLTAANTRTGDVYVLGGTLKLSGAGALGAAGQYCFIGSGATLDLGGTSQSVGVLDGSGTILNNSGGGASTFTINTTGTTAVFTGIIADNNNSTAGTVSVIKSGLGQAFMAGTNTYTGATTITAGPLIIETDSALGSATSGTTVSSGASLVLGGTTPLNISAEPITISGVGASGFTGALVSMVDGNTYGGLLKLAAAATVSSDVGTFNITNIGTITGATFALTLGGAGNGILASIIGTTSGTLTKSGLGTWTLTGANTYTGLTTISAGILNIQNASALGGTTTGTTITSGATLQIQGGINVGAEALTIRGAGASGTSGALENVSGANDYAGLITLGASSTISADAGSFLSLSNTGTITGSTFNLTLTGDGFGLLASIIGTGTGTVTKNGTGRWTLTGANTFTGAVIINAGILNVQNATALGTTAGGVTVASGAALELQGGITIGAEPLTLGGTGAIGSQGALYNLGGTNTYGGLLTLSADTTISVSPVTVLNLTHSGTITGNGLNLTLAGGGTGSLASIIGTGSGGVTKTGNGSWTLTGANTYTGNTTVNAGTLSLTNAFLANAADVNLTSGCTLNLGFAGSDTIHQLLIDNVVQSLGTWGSPSSSATFKTSLISGTGLLNVTSGAAQQPYTSWIASYGVTGPSSAFNADPNQDGIANGIAWILGGNPLNNSVSVLPQVSTDATYLYLTFNRIDASESSTTLIAQWSTNLSSWNNVPIGASSSGPDANGVIVTVTENGAAPDSVVVAIPRSLGPGRLFARLFASMP